MKNAPVLSQSKVRNTFKYIIMQAQDLWKFKLKLAYRKRGSKTILWTVLASF